MRAILISHFIQFMINIIILAKTYADISTAMGFGGQNALPIALSSIYLLCTLIPINYSFSLFRLLIKPSKKKVKNTKDKKDENKS